MYANVLREIIRRDILQDFLTMNSRIDFVVGLNDLTGFIYEERPSVWLAVFPIDGNPIGIADRRIGIDEQWKVKIFFLCECLMFRAVVEGDAENYRIGLVEFR